MYGCLVFSYVCSFCVCVCWLRRPEEGTRSPRTKITDGCELPRSSGIIMDSVLNQWSGSPAPPWALTETCNLPLLLMLVSHSFISLKGAALFTLHTWVKACQRFIIYMFVVDLVPPLLYLPWVLTAKSHYCGKEAFKYSPDFKLVLEGIEHLPLQSLPTQTAAQHLVSEHGTEWEWFWNTCPHLEGSVHHLEHMPALGRQCPPSLMYSILKWFAVLFFPILSWSKSCVR